MTAQEKFTDAELNAYVDGELSGDDRSALEERLAASPETARKAAELTRVDETVRARFASVVDEPLTEGMRAALAQSGGRRGTAWWLRAAAAALLLLAGGGGGYALRGMLEAPHTLSTELVDYAVGAHSVYVPEVRHPVEVGAGEEAHLVKWLTKRLGADVRAPTLTDRGFTLLGGRLLSATGGPAAQFMYENDDGRRLTLYIREAGPSENTAFRFANEKGFAAFYWIDRPLAYALVGEMPREELLALARLTYEQLN